jgi:hypothetical protein
MSYLTVAEFKLYKGITKSDDDALIDSIIDAATEWLDRVVGRPLYVVADATRYYDSYMDADGRTLYLDEDLASVTSVTIDGTELASTEYTTIPRNDTPYYALKIKRGSDYTWTDDNAAGDYDPEDAIEIVGKWSYFAAIPDDLKHHMRRLVDYAYNQKDAGAFETTAIPAAGVIEVPQGFPVDVARWARHLRKL